METVKDKTNIQLLCDYEDMVIDHADENYKDTKESLATFIEHFEEILYRMFK